MIGGSVWYKRLTAAVIGSLALATFIAVSASTASATACRSSGQAVGDFLAVGLRCVHVGAATDVRAHSGRSSDTIGLRYQPIRLAASVCRGLSMLAVCGGTSATCTMRARVVGGQLVGGGARDTGCTPAQPVPAGAAAAPPPPQVTPGVVLTALRRIGLPSLRARTQP